VKLVLLLCRLFGLAPARRRVVWRIDVDG